MSLRIGQRAGADQPQDVPWSWPAVNGCVPDLTEKSPIKRLTLDSVPKMRAYTTPTESRQCKPEPDQERPPYEEAHTNGGDPTDLSRPMSPDIAGVCT